MATTSSLGPTKPRSSHAETLEDIDLVNTGNLTGGIGIEVSTGANDFANAVSDSTLDPFVYSTDPELPYDDAGNPVLPSIFWLPAAGADHRYHLQPAHHRA